MGVKPGQWGWSFTDLRTSWIAAEEAGFDLVSCFDHVTSAPAGRAAWDAPSLLVAMAAVTSRIRLGVHVLNASLRSPLLLASQLATAQAASGGRVEVGLGAGSFHLARFDHASMGIAFPPYAERLGRLEACCESFPYLWRGEVVDEPRLDLAGASLGPIDIQPPPLVVGGIGPDAMRIAARHAEGWNANASDADAFAELVRSLKAACTAAGRTRPLERQAQVFARTIDPPHARALLTAFEEAGADTVVFVLDEERGPDHVRRLADVVLGR